MSQTCFIYAVNLTSLYQFSYMIKARYSHGGRVCSGDFVSYYDIPERPDMAVLRSEGNFYSTYPLIILGILAVLFTCVCCFVILMGADQVGKGLKEIDDFFMNIDNLDSI